MSIIPRSMNGIQARQHSVGHERSSTLPPSSPVTDEETADRTAGTGQPWSRTLWSWAENLYPLAQVPGYPEMRALQSPATGGSLSHGSPLRSSLFPCHLFP